jgi:hypothetical protein
MYVRARETSEVRGIGASTIGTEIANGCYAPYTASVRTTCGVPSQVGQIRYLIQTEAQTYRALPLIPNPISTFLAQHAKGDVQKIVAQVLVITKLICRQPRFS